MKARNAFFLLMAMVLTVIIFLMTGCTLFRKDQQQDDDEFVELSKEVLKKGQGIEITVKPVEKGK